jgi:hypothetical protein
LSLLKSLNTNTLYYNDKSIKLRNEINDYFNIHIKNNMSTLSSDDRKNKLDDIRSKMNIDLNTMLKYPKFNIQERDLYIIYLWGIIIDVKHYIVMECLIKRGILTKYIIRDEKFEKKPLKDEFMANINGTNINGHLNYMCLYVYTPVI